jgi:hypothetical protein
LSDFHTVGGGFDETYLARRNFDTQVELNKTIRAKDGTLVQSDGEKLIAEWLSASNIRYRYDERIKIIQGFSVRPDFYLPEFDVYIEYWGMDTIDYKIGILCNTPQVPQEVFVLESKLSLRRNGKQGTGTL